MIAYKLQENGEASDLGFYPELPPGFTALPDGNSLPDIATLHTQSYRNQRAALAYQAIRAQHYPPIADYLDAKVKQGSTDPVLQAEGLAQEKKYIDDCLAVKAAYPKPA